MEGLAIARLQWRQFEGVTNLLFELEDAPPSRGSDYNGPHLMAACRRGY